MPYAKHWHQANILDYRISRSHGLSFELLIDNKPIGMAIDSSATAIPHRVFKNGFSLFPIDRLYSNSELRIVAVCSCGEWGCDCIRCNVMKSWDDNIIFRDFTHYSNRTDKPFNSQLFSFSIDNYNSVVTEIYQKISEFKAPTQI